MKKALTVLGLAGALALSLGLAACGNNGTGTGGDKFEDLTTAESVYGFSAASAGMLISAMEGGEAQSFAAAYRGGYEGGFGEGNFGEGNFGSGEGAGAQQGAGTEQGAGQADFSELDGYMALIESLLSDGGFGVREGASEREGYEYTMVVTWRDLAGEKLEYTMHYNRLFTKTDRDDRDDRDDWDDWDEIWEDEYEEEYALEGVLVVDGQDYPVRGTRSVEEEGNESESETELRVDLGGRTMLVEQESESEGREQEQEYVYSVYEGRRLVERSAFSYEQEEGETEIKMLTVKDGVTQAFYFERERVRGQERVLLRVGSGRDAKTYIVQAHTGADGQTSYTYESIERYR